MFVLGAYITIGNYIFTHVNDVKIESSRKSLLDTAVIKLPRKYDNNIITSVLKVGDPVSIRLGYNSNLTDEFSGFVLKIGCNVPVEIECEDNMYELKRTEVKPKSWKTVKLSEIVKYIAPDAVIEVEKYDVTFTSYVIGSRLTVAKVLEGLKDQYNLDVYYRPDGKLYVGIGLWEKLTGADTTVVYDTTLNVINQSLKYRTTDSSLIKLHMESHMANGKIITYEAGDIEGEVRSANVYNMTLDDMKKIADTRIKEYKFNGLEGSINTFGEPAVRHGQLATIYDPVQPDYDGKYIIDSVVTSFGISGYRREVSLGRRIV